MGANVRETLSPKQLKALESLLADGNVTRAARAAGVAPKTVHAWLKLPLFADELRRLEGQALQGLGRRLVSLGEASTKALEDALDPAQAITVRLRAAQIVCERGPVLAELSAVIGRLEALERRLTI